MTPSGAIAECGNLLLELVIAGARTTLVAAIAGLLLKSFRVKASSARLLTWKTVLLAGLLMPVLPSFLPAVRVPVPVLVSHPAHRSISVLGIGGIPRSTVPTPPVATNATQIGRMGEAPTRARQTSISAESIFSNVIGVAAFAYAAVAVFLLLRVFTGLVLTRRLVRSATSTHGVESRSVFRNVSVRESALVTVPITVGLFSPTILLPISRREWGDAKLDAVLTHELSHVARFDALAQLVSLVHRAIFWFSPLAWWLNRHIIELAEEVSDEAALGAGAERNQYARSLLAFFETIRSTPGRVHWQGVSMATSGQPERRLEKILAWRGDTKMAAKKWIFVVAIAIAIPATYLIAAARPAQQAPQSQDPNSPQEKSVAPPSEPGAPAMPAAPSVPAVSGTPSMQGPPDAPPEPAEPMEPVAGGNHRNGYFYSYGYDDAQRFVIVSGKADAFTMSGSSEDAEHVEKLRKQISGDFIWFQRDEKSYIIRDQATVNRARQLWAPQEELGKKQEELGKQQEALGKQQEELGTRMQQVRVKVPDISAELDKLKAELKELGPNASMEQIGRIQAEIGELQSRIGEIQSHAGDEQGKIGTEMGALGEKQGKLGEQQGELGRQQGELAEKANREMKKLLDDAIRNGTAQPEISSAGAGTI